MWDNKLAGNWEQELHLQKVSTPLAQFNSYAEPRTFFSTNNNSTKLWGINCVTDLVFIDSVEELGFFQRLFAILWNWIKSLFN